MKIKYPGSKFWLIVWMVVFFSNRPGAALHKLHFCVQKIFPFIQIRGIEILALFLDPLLFSNRYFTGLPQRVYGQEDSPIKVGS
jgi:hypothetical protein